MSKLAGKDATGKDPLPEDPVLAVARNLSAVLNAKRGYAGAVRVFGLADHAIDADPKRIGLLVADMTDQVRRFEPRLDKPTVRFVGRQDSSWAKFEITGAVIGKPRTFEVLFHVVLRHVKVLPPGAP